MKKRIISILMALVMALSLLPAGALAAGLPFTDVKTSDWFYNDVKNAYDDGLINGKTATTFEPNSNLTYAEAVKLAACMNQRNATGMVTLVNGNPWYATYVGYARDNGIISKDYDWNAKATRAGYMEIFANALPAANLKPVNNVPDGAIPDVPMSHPQADAIYTLYRAGILQGSDSRHSCKPNDNIKRSEVAAILTRMMDVKERISFSMAEEVEELTITAQPKDVTCSVGDTAEFTVMVAGGKEPYKYQWQTPDLRSKVWTNITGATSATYTYKNVSDLSFSSSIRCVITDADGNTVTSNEAKVVKKTEALAITTQPQNVTCAVGDTVTFTVAASGGKAPYTYQWQTYSRMKWGSINGATSATYTYKNVSDASFSSSIRCVITDADGNTVTSNEAKVVKKTEPLIITTQPQNVTTTIPAGSSAFSAGYTVVATGGTPPYTYQWQWGVQSMSGWNDFTGSENWANPGTIKTNSLLIGSSNKSMLNQSYIFRCVIRDSAGEVEYSKLAKLSELIPLSITTQPKDVTCAVGDTATFTVAVSGGKEPYIYSWQWKRGTNFDPISRVTFNESEGLGTDTFKIKNISQNALDWNADFRCVITDADGNTVTSNEAKLTGPLTITTQPGSKYCAEDETVTLTVAVSGGKEPYKYVWQKYSRGWNNVSGATSSAITAGIGEYRCIITDADGTKVTTSNATVILKDVGVNVVFEGVKDGYAKLTAYVSGGKAPYKYHWNTGTVVTISDKSHSIWVKEGREGAVGCFVTDSHGNKSGESIQIDPEWFD